MQSKVIDGFEDYLIHEDGKVESTRFGKSKILKPVVLSNGYLQVQLCKNGKKFQKRIHRLLSEAFVPNPDNKPCVNHIDNNRQNNSVENLEWVTPAENSQHAVQQNRMSRTHQIGSKGSKNPRSKLNEHMVVIIRKLIEEKELTQTQIGSIFNVSHKPISYIKHNKSWSHI